MPKKASKPIDTYVSSYIIYSILAASRSLSDEMEVPLNLRE